MFNLKRILDVVAAQTALAEERTPTYREDLVRCLTKVLAAQDEGASSDKARRERVGKEVAALAERVVAVSRKGRTK
jgi:hypothetical protein